MTATKSQVLKLYRDMMKEAKNFPVYNFRTYALRRIKHGFNENKDIKDEEVNKKFSDGLQMYNCLKRQVLLNSLYKTDKIIMEN